jgi:8-oxo-dGTP diphosphatase
MKPTEPPIYKYSYKFPRPSVTVDCVVFGIDFRVSTPPRPTPYGELQVLLIQRGVESEAVPEEERAFVGAWALPGGFVEVSDGFGQGESLEAAAHRELAEEAGIKADYLEQLNTFGDPGRDPRGRVISVAYYALVRSMDHVAKAGSDAKHAEWYSLAPRMPLPALAFDHWAILEMALRRLQAKVRYEPVGFDLLPAKFTTFDLRMVYEAILQQPLEHRNFSRIVQRLKGDGILLTVGQERNVPHRPRNLYRFDKRAYKKAAREGFHFEL